MSAMWEKIYNRIFWKNGEESLTTPVSAANMNIMDMAIDMLDSRIVQLGVEKADNDKVGMVYIRYSANADGSDFTEKPTQDTRYIGICVLNSGIAPTEKEKYTWSYCAGTEGPQGPQGPQGPAGTGDMSASDYDADNSIKSAGGIKAYVENVLGYVETQLAAL